MPASARDVDLFGLASGAMLTRDQRSIVRGKRKSTRANGYAWTPGSGPAGETCRSCRHYTRVQGGARFHPKCALMEAHWTRGPGSDIRASAPACRDWQRPEERTA